MAKAIKRFELKLNDEAISDLDELRDNYNQSQIRDYFEDGTLLKWLNKNYYEEEAESVEELMKGAENIDERLCVIFGVEYEEELDEDIDAIIEKIKGYTDDTEIIKNARQVAFSQGELADLLDQGCKKIYLCGTSFSIPMKVENVEYIGVNCPVVKFRLKDGDSLDNHSIKFENVEFADGTVASQGKIEKAETYVEKSDIYYIDTICVENRGTTGLRHMSRDASKSGGLHDGSVDVMDVLYCEDKDGNVTRISENVRGEGEFRMRYYNVLDFVETKEYVFYTELGEDEDLDFLSYIFIIKFNKSTKEKSVIYEGTSVLHNNKAYGIRKSTGIVWDVKKNEQQGDNMLYVLENNLIVRLFDEEFMIDFNGNNKKPLAGNAERGKLKILWTIPGGYYGIRSNGYGKNILSLVKGRVVEDIFEFRYLKNVFVDDEKVIIFDYDGNYNELVAYYYDGKDESEVVRLKKFGKEYAEGECFLKKSKITLRSDKGNTQILEY